MKFLQQEIVEIIETNLQESFAVWDAEKTYYVEDDEENLTSDNVARDGNFYYRTAIDENIGNNPSENEGDSWVVYRPSNRYAMLDTHAKTLTQSDEDFYIKIKRDFIELLAFGNVIADSITIENLDAEDNVISTQTIDTTAYNEDVDDYWSYIYSKYDSEITRAFLVTISPIGEYLKISFTKNSIENKTQCGFLVGGQPVDFGDTLYDVNFSYNTIGDNSFDEWGRVKSDVIIPQDMTDFETLIDAGVFAKTRTKIKNTYGKIGVFIIDESKDSKYDNLLSLARIMSTTQVLSNSSKVVLSWSIAEIL